MWKVSESGDDSIFVPRTTDYYFEKHCVGLLLLDNHILCIIIIARCSNCSSMRVIELYCII